MISEERQHCFSISATMRVTTGAGGVLSKSRSRVPQQLEIVDSGPFSSCVMRLEIAPITLTRSKVSSFFSASSFRRVAASSASLDFSSSAVRSSTSFPDLEQNAEENWGAVFADKVADRLDPKIGVRTGFECPEKPVHPGEV